MANFYAHPNSLVETDAVGAGTRIWAFAHLMPGATVGANCNVGDRVFVETGAVVGDHVTLKNNVCIWQGVTIEDGAFIGPGVLFTNDRHPRSPRLPSARARYAHSDQWLLETVVGEGCSIGAGAVILPGLRLGPYSMIAAGACVTDNVAPYALMVGSPATAVGCVCRCGKKLPGCHLVSTCVHCGEIPAARTHQLAVSEAPSP